MTYYNQLTDKANALGDGIVTFHNSSWHNDACGSIMFDYDEEQENYIQLFAFETAEDMKAEGFEERFMVQAVIEGDWIDQTIFFTNDEDEALAHAVKLAKEMQDDQDVKGYEAMCQNGFEWQGVWIEDRTKSPCGRFDLTPEQSSELYGKGE